MFDLWTGSTSGKENGKDSNQPKMNVTECLFNHLPTIFFSNDLPLPYVVYGLFPRWTCRWLIILSLALLFFNPSITSGSVPDLFMTACVQLLLKKSSPHSSSLIISHPFQNYLLPLKYQKNHRKDAKYSICQRGSLLLILSSWQIYTFWSSPD